MPGQINRVPEGFLSLLGLKQQGKTPALLPDSVAPVLELGHLYATHEQRMYSEQTATLGVPIADVVVPDGKLWVPIHAAVSYATPVAGQVGFMRIIETRLAIDDFQAMASNRQLVLAEGGPPANAPSALNSKYSCVYSWPRAIAYPPGSQFVFEFSENNFTVAATCNAYMFYLSLTV